VIGVRFWGTRGSLPVALTADDVRARVVTALHGAIGRELSSMEAIEKYVNSLDFDVRGTFGGHTSCVEIDAGGPDYVVCDLGTGARPFGRVALTRSTAPRTYHVFMSHVHWDHIMGLPFFAPAYVPGNRIVIYGGHAELESALRRQMDPPSFPVDFSTLRADFEFARLAPGQRHEVAGMTVTTLRQRHTGDSYGYRFERNGRVVVYSTDSEHPLADPEDTKRFVQLFRDADLVIFDAMYSLADAISVKADWGHSSNIVGVELCQLAGARHLCLFHHEPAENDTALVKVLTDTRQLETITRIGRPLRVSAAYDGLEITL
jgi:phosphoribosyl 1,2-cyclic phosphodiesterase